MKIPTEFYQREDVVTIAQQLLGKKLCTYINGEYCSGKIVETEVYKAPEDSASHAYQLKKTPRTETMFSSGGTTYVYLIYGVYKLFNVVTNQNGIPHAILIRAVEPLENTELMLRRRNLTQIQRNLTGGPGLLSMAMGIEIKHNGLNLTQELIWIEDASDIEEKNIIKSARVGLGKNVFEPYFSMPWRFRIKDNLFTSPAK